MAVMDTSYLCPISGTLASDFAPWPPRRAGRRISRAATSIIYTQGFSVLTPGADLSHWDSVHPQPTLDPTLWNNLVWSVPSCNVCFSLYAVIVCMCSDNSLCIAPDGIDKVVWNFIEMKSFFQLDFHCLL